MEKSLESRTCTACGKGIKGRTDKKFCNDNCRNLYNNHLRTGEEDYIRKVNRILKRNRRILREILPAGRETGQTSMRQLEFLQFHFCFYTHSHTNKKGNTFRFCYEFGYLSVSRNRVIVVKRATHLNLLDPFLQYR